MDEVEAGLFAQNQHKLEICFSTSHMEGFRAAGALTITAGGIFLKQGKKSQGPARQKYNERGEKGTLQRGVKLSTGSVYLCGTGRAF